MMFLISQRVPAGLNFSTSRGTNVELIFVAYIERVTMNGRMQPFFIAYLSKRRTVVNCHSLWWARTAMLQVLHFD